ncbi:MAG TPA: MerR family transcriptional regulator [Thermoflexales bacterium]|nr:MerR family transcriptional regulator [Thermoflexales bacterium]HQW34624.1 MerR family transcriptional regulator [Thermoflexales bacterium]HQX74668.1 MerR family transcriptional regulator [Thermoflexales bacterium]HQZ99349.1 MerR family transcriptional regulator [Thermoflexales bacterium]
MFRIGDFAKLTRVPVKTLRFYDEIGLLHPAQVDRFTDYRYYSAEQLPRLNRILALKDLGVSLEQIKSVVDGALSAENLRGMLILRREQLCQEMQDAAQQLMRVEARIQQIEMEGNMNTPEVVVKNVEAMWVASAGTVVADYSNLGPVFDHLFEVVCDHVRRVSRQTGPGIALYRDDGSMKNVPVEALAPIAKPIPPTEDVKVYQLEGATMASTLHHGQFHNIGTTYDALMKWVEANGYYAAGYPREVYLSMDKDKPETWITEIQFPIQPAS